MNKMFEIDSHNDENYWKISAWQAAIALTVEMEHTFKHHNPHFITQDTLLLATELSSQISLGFEEQSPNKSLVWLHRAKQVCTRIRTRLYLAKEMVVLNQKIVTHLIEKTREVATLLTKAIHQATHSMHKKPKS